MRISLLPLALLVQLLVRAAVAVPVDITSLARRPKLFRSPACEMTASHSAGREEVGVQCSD